MKGSARFLNAFTVITHTGMTSKPLSGWKLSPFASETTSLSQPHPLCCSVYPISPFLSKHERGVKWLILTQMACMKCTFLLSHHNRLQYLDYQTKPVTVITETAFDANMKARLELHEFSCTVLLVSTLSCLVGGEQWRPGTPNKTPSSVTTRMH